MLGSPVEWAMPTYGTVGKPRGIFYWARIWHLRYDLSMAAKYPNKEIRAAIEYAENHGWHVVKATGHAHIWGKLLCPCHAREGCLFHVHSTPANPENHAARLRRAVDRCEHLD